MLSEAVVGELTQMHKKLPQTYARLVAHLQTLTSRRNARELQVRGPKGSAMYWTVVDGYQMAYAVGLKGTIRVLAIEELERKG